MLYSKGEGDFGKLIREGEMIMTNWRYKFNMVAVLHNDDMAVEDKAKKIAQMIENNRCFGRMVHSIQEFFESYDSTDDHDFALFDSWLADLYDFADSNLIWLSGGKDI